MIHSGIQSFFHPVPQDFHFGENISLSNQASGTLFGICRTERCIKIVFHGKAFLHIDTGPQPLSRSHNNSDIAFIHKVKEFLTLFVGFIIIDDGNFIGGDPPVNQFAFDFSEYIEVRNFSAGKLIKITEYDLCAFDGIVIPVFLQNLFHTDIEFGTGIIHRIFGNQSEVNGCLAAETVDHQRDMAEMLFLGIIQFFKPAVKIGKVIHKTGYLRCSRKFDLFRMTAFNGRLGNPLEILRQNHIGTTAEHLGKFHHIGIFGKACYHFQPSGSIDFQCRFTQSKG